MIDDRAVEAAKQALAHCERNPRLIDCPRCKGVGYVHGYGEDGADPDWCDECGGGKYIVDPNHAAEAALTAAAPFLTQMPDGWKLVPFGWCRRYVKGDRPGIEVSIGAERPPEWESADPLYSLAPTKGGDNG